MIRTWIKIVNGIDRRMRLVDQWIKTDCPSPPMDGTSRSMVWLPWGCTYDRRFVGLVENWFDGLVYWLFGLLYPVGVYPVVV